MRLYQYISLAFLASLASSLPAGQVAKSKTNSISSGNSKSSPRISSAAKPVPAAKTVPTAKSIPAAKTVPIAKTVSAAHTTLSAKAGEASVRPKNGKTSSDTRIKPDAKAQASAKTRTNVNSKATSTARVGTKTTAAAKPTSSAATDAKFDVTCADLSDTAVFRRTFPKVDGVQSCKKIKDTAQLMTTLEANGNLWLQALAQTQKTPPAELESTEQFDERYKITAAETTIRQLSKHVIKDGDGVEKQVAILPSVLKKLELTPDTPMQEIIVTAGDEKPYVAAVNNDRTIFFALRSFTDEDSNGADRLKYEDIMTYMLAFVADQNKFFLNEVDWAAAVRPVKYIVRNGITNHATNVAVAEAYNRNHWTQDGQLRSVVPNSPIGKALLATNNGNIGPKFLGSNMAHFHSGSVSAIDIVQEEVPANIEAWKVGSSMILTLTHY